MRPVTVPPVGFVGMGEVVRVFGRGMRRHHPDRELLSYGCGHHRPPYDPEYRAQAAAAGFDLVSSLRELCRRADTIVSAVVADRAVAIGLDIADAIRAGTLVVDVNASSPEDKRVVARSIEAAGGRYVDASIMGSVPTLGLSVPMFCSGSGARELGGRDLGFTDVTVVSERAGDAALVKYLRSVIMKGLESVLVEALVPAEANGIYDLVLESVLQTIREDGGPVMINALICSESLHAARRAEEMRKVASVLEGEGLPADMTRATIGHLVRVAPLPLDRSRHARDWDAHGVIRDLLAQLSPASVAQTT
jgi:3-hydroxyisobutyrate dehydrogenase-like beta-hydroxyacid dehydrogenase